MHETDNAHPAHHRHARLTIPEFQALVDEVPLAVHMRCAVQELDHGAVRVLMPYAPGLLRPGGTISGPAMMTLADIALWGAVLSAIGPVALAVTSDLTFHFLRKPPPGDIQASARLLQLGRRLAVAEASISDTTGGPILAHAVGTYAIPQGARPQPA